jgi:RNA polymerase sigma-54 factor
MNVAPRLVSGQKQTQKLGQRQLQGLTLLAKSLPALRSEIAAEIDRNPALEDMDHPLETSLSEMEQKSDEMAGEPDYPVDDFTPGLSRDEALADRRQSLFDNQVKVETLQEHLLSQLPLSDIAPADWALAEMLVGDLDEKGYWKGSLPDVMMVFGRTEAEVLSVLAKIRQLDPPGCGARDTRECLLAQMDALEDSPYEDEVRAIIERHLDDLAAGRFGEIERALNLTHAQYAMALKELRTLDGRPGRQYPSERERVEYVNPEIHAVRRDGRWIAETDARSLPALRLSPAFEALLKDPAQSEETKAYVRERIAAAKAFRDAVAKRRETVQAIAQAIFDRQPGFFAEGLKGLRPLTEREIAEAVGVHATTVSRTVRDKYAATPKGTIELRRFFLTGVKTTGGETLTQEAVLERLKAVVAAEDPAAPLSDEKIAAALKAAGCPVARRTIAKYRDRLGIPGASRRRLTTDRGGDTGESASRA